MIRNNLLLSTSICILFLSAACQYNVEEELYPETDGCNLNNITYSKEVTDVLRNNCYSCHDQQNRTSGIVLEGYDNLIKYVDNGRLLGAIRREPGFSPMPQNAPKLLDCDIDKIAQWIDDGAPDN